MVLLRKGHSLLVFVILFVFLALTDIIELQSYVTAAENDDVCQDDVQNQNHDAQRRNQDDNMLFYAWSTTPPTNATESASLINALFPNLSQFQYAWENYPLLSRVSFSNTQQNQFQLVDTTTVNNNNLQQIPTILHNRELISQLKLNNQPNNNSNNDNHDPILSLLSVEETEDILSQPMLLHGSDYQLLKNIILPSDHPTEPGEEYDGMLPKPHYSVEEAMLYINKGAFSLIINKVQNRWKSVANFARVLEDELNVVQVGVNLYLTPEVVKEEDRVDEYDRKNGDVRQGFGSHWDFMDGK